MLCPRCNYKLDFIITEIAYEEFESREHLCMRCFMFVQEVFKDDDLVFTMSGELDKV